MGNADSTTINLIAREETTEDRAEMIRLSDYLYAKKVSVPADQLAENIREFVEKMQGVLDEPPGDTGTFSVTSITISAEISAKGTLNILGTGGEIAGKGGITFVFTRK